MNQIIETQLNTSTTLSAGSLIPLGTIVHKQGNSITANGTVLNIRGAGYFKVIAVVNVEPTAVADMTVTLSENGTAIGTATATPAVASDSLNMTVTGIIYNPCGCANDNVTLSVSSAGAVTSMTVIAERM